MARITVPDAEILIDKELPVLNKGFVRLVDYLGGDARIVQAARVSYGSGTKTLREDAALIDYLLRNDHTSPFEQVVFTFHVKMPIFVARQWIRHRTARINEVSGRYSVLADEFFEPQPETVRKQSVVNRQGRAEPLATEVNRQFLDTLKADQVLLYDRYQTYVKLDIARELARVNLPLSVYTQFYWQIDLHNLFHFLKLRLDAHAQVEIRAYGEALAECARSVAPIAYKSFERHVLGSIRLSSDERAELLKALRDVPTDEAARWSAKLGK